jgi:tetratricopeptide (TPR) repeat protein
MSFHRSSPAFHTLLLSILVCGFGCATADTITYSKWSYREGVELYRQQAYANAAGAFQNATRQNPKDYRAHFYLGASNQKLARYQQAIQAYKTGLDVMQVTYEGRKDWEWRVLLINGLASSIAKSDRRDIETNAAELELKTRPGAATALLLAKIHAYQGDADSAMTAFERATLAEPENFYIFKEYGLYLEQLSQTTRAEGALRRAYSLKQDDPEVVEALRRMGIVPGPSLRDQEKLARPLAPSGPIPDFDPSRARIPGSSASAGGRDE